MRVVVVGAGFAGLACADELVRAGHERRRARGSGPGRRAGLVVPRSRGRSGRAVVERGAEFVLDGYDVQRALCARFGLEVRDTGMTYYVREPRGGIGATAEALTAASAALAGAATGPGVGVPEALDGLDLEPGVREALEARIQMSCAAPLATLSADVITHVASVAPLRSARVAGGNQQVALRLAAELGSVVHLSTPVLGVSHSDRGVVVSTEAGEVVGRPRGARRAAACARRPRRTSLACRSGSRRRWARVEYGHAAKLQVPLLRAAPTSAVMATTDCYWSWTLAGSGAEGGDGPCVEPAVHCFSGSAPALAGLGVVDGPATWLDKLTGLRPDLALDIDARAAHDLVGRPVGARRLQRRQRPRPARRRGPAGPRRRPGLHFAGEWTAGAWSGLMEGGLRSGLRAATEISVATRTRQF